LGRDNASRKYYRTLGLAKDSWRDHPSKCLIGQQVIVHVEVVIDECSALDFKLGCSLLGFWSCFMGAPFLLLLSSLIYHYQLLILHVNWVDFLLAKVF